MLMLEQYEQLIERDPRDISYGWKLTVVTAYFCCSIASYACAFLFYVFWYEVSGGRCLFWATVKLPSKFEKPSEKDLHCLHDWTHHILIYQDAKYCERFEFVCMVSCTAAISFLIIFSICGKGGHDNSLFVAPWRAVLPAISCSLGMTIATIIASHQFTAGYFYFSNQIYEIANKIIQIQHENANITGPCDTIEIYTKNTNLKEFKPCNVYWLTRMFAWIMTWSWIVSLLTLGLRILTFVDFTLLKVKVFEPNEQPATRQELLEMIQKKRDSSDVKEITIRRSKAVRVKVL